MSRQETRYVTIAGSATAAQELDLVAGTNVTLTPVVVGRKTTLTVAASGGGGGAPTTVDYLVRTADAGLSAERVVTDTATVTWDWATGGQAKASVVLGSGGALAYDAGLTSLTSADSAAGLAYPDGADSWTRLALASADLGIYTSSAGVLASYSLTASGRSLGGITLAATSVVVGTGAGTAGVKAATRGAVLYGAAGPVWDVLALGTSGYVLQSNGTDLIWGPYSGAGFGSLLTTRGDTLVRDATTVVRLPLGASGYVLRSDGTDALWAALTYPDMPGGSQSITADTTLTTQRAHLISDGSWAITLPTVASWTIGVPTLITYDGATEATIQIVPNAADKVNGSARAALVGTRIVATLTPVAANKFTLTVQSGRLLWLHILLDPTTATGAGPYTVGSTTWTDISTASSSVTSVSGFLFNSKSGSAYTGGASADCALIRSPCSGLVDSWSRPFDPTTQRAWLMVKGSKTTTVGGSTPAWILGIGGSTVSVVPRIAADISGAAGVAQYIARDSASQSINLTEATFTSAGWLGFCWDPVALRIVDGICSTSPSGSPGSSGGFWPTSYRNAERMKVGQDYFGSVWRVGNLTDVHIAQTTPTTGSKYTATEFAILIEEVAP